MKKKLYGTIKNQDGARRIRTKEEIGLLIKHADIVRYIKAQRIRWIGDSVRMDKEWAVKRITEWRRTAERSISRTRIRWEDDVRADLGKTKIQKLE